MKPKVIIAPVEEPISIEEARAHLEAQPYADSDVDPIDDTMIAGWLAAAREYCENFTGLSLATKTLEIALDCFPTSRVCWPFPRSNHAAAVGIDLPFGPVRDVISIAWGTESEQIMEAEDFTLDDFSRPSRIVPVASAWPMVTRATNVIRIRYLAGYGVDSDGGEELPKAIRAAILLILGHLYANRENSTDVALISIPTGAEAFLKPYQVVMGMA